MLGPGTVYLDCDAQQYNDSIQSVARNECPAHLLPLHAEDAEEEKDFNERLHWKETLVEHQAKDADGIQPSHAATGQAVFFTGGTWANFAGDDQRAGVVHRSPHNVNEKQARVFLALDVVLGGNSHDDGCDCCPKEA
ncbi:MAG: hypothetical protein SGARI_007255 [Bacillariaceae sp.]